MSSLSSRDRRALLLLALVGLPLLAWYFLTGQEEPTAPVNAAATLPLPVLEKRLVTLRQQAALNPAKQEVREALQKELDEREKLLLTADTAQQVQADLLARVRGVLELQDPPMRAAQSELGPISRVGDDYGEVAVSVGFGCTIEQLVNVMADVAALEPLVATRQLNVLSADRAKKTINVRLTVTALMPVSLAPQPTGGLLP